MQNCVGTDSTDIRRRVGLGQFEPANMPESGQTVMLTMSAFASVPAVESGRSAGLRPP